jgi:membrane fusion protein (multidrug efflux system)
MVMTLIEPSKGKKIRKKIIILSVVTLVVIWFGAKFYHILKYEETDNAQIEGDIVPVRTSVPGYIATVNFQDNDYVHKGQVLAVIDDRDLKSKVEEAKAALDNAIAARIQLNAVVNASSTGVTATAFSAQAMQQNIAAAKARLQKVNADYERTKQLVALHGATSQQMDAAEADKSVAIAQLQLAEKQFLSYQNQTHASASHAESVRLQRMIADALIKQRTAELALAQSQLNYASIVAPYSGRVSKKNIEPGQYVQPGQLLCALVSSDSIWLVANFKETQIHNMDIGQRANVYVDAFPGEVFTGTISSFSAATGARFSLLPPDNATGNFVKVTQRIPVRILLNKPVNEKYHIVPGMNVRVSVRKK